MGNEHLLLGIFGVFGVLGISFFVAGGFWDSVGRGPRRGFRKYLTSSKTWKFPYLPCFAVFCGESITSKKFLRNLSLA